MDFLYFYIRSVFVITCLQISTEKVNLVYTYHRYVTFVWFIVDHLLFV